MKVKIGMCLLILISGLLYHSLAVNAFGYLSDSIEIFIGRVEPLKEEMNTTQDQPEDEHHSATDADDDTESTRSQTESTETSETAIGTSAEVLEILEAE